MEQSASPTSKPKVSKLAVLSFILSFIPILCVGGAILGFISCIIIREYQGKLSGVRLALAALIIGVINFFLTMSIPRIIRMKPAQDWSNVKSVAYTTQIAVEDYKEVHNGLRPNSMRGIDSLLPKNIKQIKNPYYNNQTYTFSGGGLVDGDPTRAGEVGYIAPRDSAEPYRILTFRKGDTLRLTEEMATAKVNSSGTKSP